jgi:hypothetical protein
MKNGTPEKIYGTPNCMPFLTKKTNDLRNFTGISFIKY